MFVTPRRALLWAVLAAVAYSPSAVGALPFFHGARLLLVALFAFSVYAFSFARSQRPRQAALVLLSVCFAVTFFDLAARSVSFYLYEWGRPAALSVRHWPPLWQLPRYAPGVNFEGMNYGDLAAKSGRSDWREPRRVRFVTDAYGFRNEPPAPGEAERPLDVIVLSDSFGATAGTSQEHLLSSVLAREYGLSVYNLSVSGSSPQQEYVTLLLESGRLKTREGTRVLWLLFAGNDLDDPYSKELENPKPHRPGWFERFASDYEEFRARSPVRRLVPDQSEVGVERKLPDGRPMLFLNTYARRKCRTADEVRLHPNFEGLRTTFAAMRRLADERHLRVEVALVPSKEEVYSWVLDGAPPWTSSEEPSGLSVALGELCGRQGFRFLDLKPALVEASRRAFEESGALLWWRDDTHWNPAGQRVAASVVFDRLLRGPVLEPANPRL